MINRMDDGVQANRLEKLIMHDQAIHEIDHLPQSSMKVRLTAKGEKRLDELTS